MRHPLLDQELLDSIKRNAKKNKREDPCLTYNQWLDALSAEHGFATFSSLKYHVDQLTREAELATDEALWAERLAPPMVWGTKSDMADGSSRETLELPFFGGQVPWPNCFARSSLFSCAEGPRRQLTGPLFTIDYPDMEYVGEELRAEDDQEILMMLMLTIGRAPFGRVVTFTPDDLRRAAGAPFAESVDVFRPDAITRSLWRLVHGELTVPDMGFRGPLLSYVDARKAPTRFKVRFNPSFTVFFHSPLWLALLGVNEPGADKRAAQALDDFIAQVSM